MTELNKSNPKNTHINNVDDQQIDTVQANSQQVSVKAWSQKLLVILLCLASFYGGWKSYESNMINDCTANGGQMIEGQRIMLCQLS